MPSKLVRLIGDDLDIVINLERITHVASFNDFVAIWFAGERDSLKLTGEVAKDFWRCITACSIVVHRKQHKSQSEGALTYPDNSDWNTVNPAQQSSTADRPN